ncbi:MAG: flagellar basal body rod protein FlgB [Pseudomonadota bacterium]
MAINFDKALGIHEQALMLRAQRNGILATNIANADTPNYKARDIDFSAAMASLKSGASNPVSLQATQNGHIGVESNSSLSPLGAQLQYRLPQQPSLDGNTVEAHIEEAAYADNALRYQASLQFLGSKFASLKSVISGGR